MGKKKSLIAPENSLNEIKDEFKTPEK